MSFFQLTNQTQLKQIPCENNSFWIQTTEKKQFHDHQIEIGSFTPASQYLACYRFSSCWMKSKLLNKVEDIPAETQFLIAKKNNLYFILIPLIDRKARASLLGQKNGQIAVHLETFDPTVSTQEMIIAYGIEGSNPYRMMEIAAKEIQKQYHPSSNARQTIPFVSKLGWCTYNAFYENLSESGIRTVLNEYQEQKIALGYMILDAGWQSINNNNQVSHFKSDPIKFPHGLQPMIDRFKRDFSLSHVIAWQAFAGYWQGIHPEALKGISEVTFAKFEFPKRFETTTANTLNQATAGDEFYPGNLIGKEIGIPLPDFKNFFEHYHQELASQGVDGIKVDAMTWVEAFSTHYGGRVQAMNSLIKGLEASSQNYFDGNLLNCSSCSNDFIFQTTPGALTRTSTDFFPDIPESHGIHLMVNAHTSFFMGEFILPDWDMFQTGHAAGDFHAASRAISGGPVYTTDELGTMNFTLLKKLALPNGDLPLCKGYAKPTLDSLFTSLESDVKILKVFNHNAHSSILGIFNCSNPKWGNEKNNINFSPEEIDGIEGTEFIIHDHHSDEIEILNKRGNKSVDLAPLEFSLFTISPIQHQFSLLGIKGYFNIGGTIEEYKISQSHAEVIPKTTGILLAYSKTRPSRVRINNSILDSFYDPTSGKLEINYSSKSDIPISIEFM